MEAGRRGAADRNPAAVTRAARWALKRVLRGAFEAVDGIGWYTRDLYWCGPGLAPVPAAFLDGC